MIVMKLSEMNNNRLNEYISLVKRIFTEDIEISENKDYLRNFNIIKDKIAVITSGNTINLCQIRVDENENYYCTSCIVDENNKLVFGSFSITYFNVKEKVSFEEILEKYNVG